MKPIFFLLLLTAAACKAQEKLELPLPDGYFKNVANKKDMILYPNKDFHVRAAESGIVKSIAYIDSTYMISLKGKYQIDYMNLCKVYVKKGEKIERGKIIGDVLFVNGAPDISALIMRISKDGKYIINAAIFDK